MEIQLYKIKGFFWKPLLTIHGAHMTGPFCPKCTTELINVGYNTFKCIQCDVSHSLGESVEHLRGKIKLIYEASVRSKLPKVSLDEPPTIVKVRDSDDNYFLAARIGQKDGKKVGVVYFGEKKKEQSKEDYSQIFIDLEDEQLRFDKSNKHPKDILLKFRAEFPHSDIELTTKK